MEYVRLEASSGKNFIRVSPSRATHFTVNGNGGTNYLMLDTSQTRLAWTTIYGGSTSLYRFAYGLGLNGQV